MNDPNREGESGPIPFRTDRFFCIKDEWYFTTREGQTHGPFDSKEEADASLALFLNFVPKYGK